jgi:hypothetical protein
MSITMEEVNDELVATLAPYIKGFPEEGGKPNFRKKLTREEVESIFTALYTLTKRTGETI